MSKQTDLITLTDGVATDSNGNVGIGTDAPAAHLEVSDVLDATLRLTSTKDAAVFTPNVDTYGKIEFYSNDASAGGVGLKSAIRSYVANTAGGQSAIAFTTSSSTSNDVEAMRIDSSGNLLVGKTALSGSTAGAELFSAGLGRFVRSGGDVLNLNRLSSDGTIADFQKDGSSVGSIGTTGTEIYVGYSNAALRFRSASNVIMPWNASSNSSRDNAIDLGNSSNRFDDVYATNGTIQTSDANEKQAIASLTAPELEAAKAISGLFKNFKWNDSVEEKGVDAARIHTGVIAQEVEQALIDAGLEAGTYAFFVSTDWVDEETGEERNRKGIRYPQLLSFVAAATEQRLTSIEARLDLIEGGPS